MRYDMHKVVIERPRGGLRYKYPRGAKRNRDLDALPSSEGMKRQWKLSKEWKEFSDLLGPLRRFLMSRVGRSWDDVYSEVRERLNPRSTAQIHILGHVLHFVERHTRIVDGEVCVFGYVGYRPVWPGAMYVHPETGLLCRIPERSPPWRQDRQQDDPDKKSIGRREARLIGDIWYWVTEEDVDVCLCFDEKKRPYYSNRRIVKRQMSRRELARHGLNNRAVV